MYTGLQVRRPFFLADFNENLIFWIHLKKYSTLHENLSCGSRVVHAEGQTDSHVS